MKAKKENWEISAESKMREWEKNQRKLWEKKIKLFAKINAK